jgi:hypothetical protein
MKFTLRRAKHPRMIELGFALFGSFVIWLILAGEKNKDLI